MRGFLNALLDESPNGIRARPDFVTGAPFVQRVDLALAYHELDSHVLFLHFIHMPRAQEERN